MQALTDNISPHTSFQYTPGQAFGTAHMPVVLSGEISHSNRSLNKLSIDNLGPMEVSPFCSALHYGQSIFEGLKAYRQTDGTMGIFRPELHAQRFARSAQKMAMPEINTDIFMHCLVQYVKACKPFMPANNGISLYLRPLLFANDPVIKLRSSHNYRFMIMSTVVEQYFKPNQPGGKALINKQLVRAFPGGTGEAKTASNYAVSLQGLEYAIAHGYDQVLYLDATSKSKIEELGGMNFFTVKDNVICTPKLDGQILHGITRKTVLEIAKNLDFKTLESDIHLEDLLNEEEKEIFACGTAASIANLSQIGIQDSYEHKITTYDFPKSSVSAQLRQILTDTHYGKSEFSKKWLHFV